jgi:DNA-directed RNA polymerase subunit M/transcription elongation factor TFIIS
MTTYICVWPDDTWCYEDEVEQQTHKSDDYFKLRVPEGKDPDEYLAEFNKYVNAEPKYPPCPSCGEEADILHIHRYGDMTAPEVDYLQCQSCGHTWDYQ